MSCWQRACRAGLTFKKYLESKFRPLKSRQLSERIGFWAVAPYGAWVGATEGMVLASKAVSVVQPLAGITGALTLGVHTRNAVKSRCPEKSETFYLVISATMTAVAAYAVFYGLDPYVALFGQFSGALLGGSAGAVMLGIPTAQTTRYLLSEPGDSHRLEASELQLANRYIEQLPGAIQAVCCLIGSTTVKMLPETKELTAPLHPHLEKVTALYKKALKPLVVKVLYDSLVENINEGAVVWPFALTYGSNVGAREGGRVGHSAAVLTAFVLVAGGAIVTSRQLAARLKMRQIHTTLLTSASAISATTAVGMSPQLLHLIGSVGSIFGSACGATVGGYVVGLTACWAGNRMMGNEERLFEGDEAGDNYMWKCAECEVVDRALGLFEPILASQSTLFGLGTPLLKLTIGSLTYNRRELAESGAYLFQLEDRIQEEKVGSGSALDKTLPELLLTEKRMESFQLVERSEATFRKELSGVAAAHLHTAAGNLMNGLSVRGGSSPSSRSRNKIFTDFVNMEGSAKFAIVELMRRFEATTQQIVLACLSKLDMAGESKARLVGAVGNHFIRIALRSSLNFLQIVEENPSVKKAVEELQAAYHGLDETPSAEALQRVKQLNAQLDQAIEEAIQRYLQKEASIGRRALNSSPVLYKKGLGVKWLAKEVKKQIGSDCSPIERVCLVGEDLSEAKSSVEAIFVKERYISEIIEEQLADETVQKLIKETVEGVAQTLTGKFREIDSLLFDYDFSSAHKTAEMESVLTSYVKGIIQLFVFNAINLEFREFSQRDSRELYYQAAQQALGMYNSARTIKNVLRCIHPVAGKKLDLVIKDMIFKAEASDD